MQLEACRQVNIGECNQVNQGECIQLHLGECSQMYLGELNIVSSAKHSFWHRFLPVNVL